MTFKNTFRTIKKAVGVVALVGILSGSTKFVLDSVCEQPERAYIGNKINHNIINNPRVPLDTPEVYIQEISRALRRGVKRGEIVKAYNENGTRIREFKYGGVEEGYRFTPLREYEVNSNN